MTKLSSKQLISPTVATVLESFLEKIKGDATIDKEITERLSKTLLENHDFDPKNLSLALFGSGSELP